MTRLERAAKLYTAALRRHKDASLRTIAVGARPNYDRVAYVSAMAAKERARVNVEEAAARLAVEAAVANGWRRKEAEGWA